MIAALTGAGISAESGIPTFRGKDGLWSNLRSEDLANPETFRSNPELVWKWYFWRRSLIAKANPNRAHLALKILEDHFRENFWIITQNVDGLHHKAGNKNVIELHGNIWYNRCTSCKRVWKDESTEMIEIPRCEVCGAIARPDVVWFGELVRNFEDAVEIVKMARLLLVIGTSLRVYPAAQLPLIARAFGARIIEINTERTFLSDIADECYLGKAGDILPSVVERILSDKKIILDLKR